MTPATASRSKAASKKSAAKRSPAAASKTKDSPAKPATRSPGRPSSRAGAAKPSKSPTSAVGKALVPPTVTISYSDRLAKLQGVLASKDLSHMLITDPRDVGYLTGFLGGDSYLLVSADAGVKPIIISDFRYQEELSHFEKSARIVIRKTTMLPCVAETFKEEGVRRCGVQGDHMTLAQRDALAEQLEKLGITAAGDSLVTTREVLLTLRRVKDAGEVELIRHAVKIQQQSLMVVLPTIRPGQTELEIAARLEGEMKSRGSVEPAFTSIVAAQANGSLPHYAPGFVKTVKNQPLLIDWGAMWQGYRSDMTRTFNLGKWSPKMREIYQIVLDAHVLSADALKAGRTTAEIDKIARDHITKHGYGEHFGHGLGHGIGINIHEEPRLTQQTAPVALEAGNVLTIEPGIYLPGVGGVRIENDYLITESGCQCLCTLPMNLEWSTLG